VENDTVILLDLENTVIKHWSEPMLINKEALRSFIQNVKSTVKESTTCSIGIYSYAIWCEKNYTTLIEKLLPMVEKELGIEFDEDYVFTMDELMEDFARKNNKIDYGSYCSVINKEKSILDFHVGNPKFVGKNIILIDDTVTHGLMIVYPNLDTMHDPKIISFIHPEYINLSSLEL
jgi:hypothetical protein